MTRLYNWLENENISDETKRGRKILEKIIILFSREVSKLNTNDCICVYTPDGDIAIYKNENQSWQIIQDSLGMLKTNMTFMASYRMLCSYLNDKNIELIDYEYKSEMYKVFCANDPHVVFTKPSGSKLKNFV